ncbi:MAG: hypothetical protein RR214_00265 [Synergistaceae bacterium]
MSNYKPAYTYNPTTGELTGETKAWESPLEPGIYHLPANATYTLPIAANEKEVACWDSATSKWESRPDHRGETWWHTTTKEKKEIKEIGAIDTTSYTQMEPSDYAAEWSGTAWVVPFDVLKQRKITDIKREFNLYVGGSFVCSLGYPMQFDRKDSLAMEGAIKLLEASGAQTGYLTDANDVSHYDVALADIQKVQMEMLSTYAAAHAKKQSLREQVEIAKNETELAGITITFGGTNNVNNK